ncbi:DUF4384 domain-containing protein [Leptospira ilyithenensis]|uniref:DUF4384 domain-containing protein n=1 Tax=Leptospira ilyithenensis TaxID=2484901 RepID=UPI003CCC8C66
MLLFPNPVKGNNFLKKGEKIIIPSEPKFFIASPPFGKYKLRAFASKEEWKGLIKWNLFSRIVFCFSCNPF